MQLMLASIMAESISSQEGSCEQHGIQCTWHKTWFFLQKALRAQKTEVLIEKLVAEDRTFSKINESPWYLIHL